MQTPWQDIEEQTSPNTGPHWSISEKRISSLQDAELVRDNLDEALNNQLGHLRCMH